MKIQVLREAQQDMVDGSLFYDGLEAGLGAYFFDCLSSDIEALRLYAGIHPVMFSYHRALSIRFPFAVYYSLDRQRVRVVAVLDCRRRPAWTRNRLREVV